MTRVHSSTLELFGRFTTVFTVYYSALKYIFIWEDAVCFIAPYFVRSHLFIISLIYVLQADVQKENNG